MTVVSRCCFWLMFLLTKCYCEYVDFFTSTHLEYTLLTKYGYVFDPSKQVNFISFQVKACRDAVVSLFESEDDIGNQCRMTIGGWSNTKTAIRALQSETELDAALHTEVGILSCDEYRYFWISWTNDGEVVLGRGEDVFKNAILNLRQDAYKNNIRYVGISSLWDSFVNWRYPRLGCQQLRVLPQFKNIFMTTGIEWSVGATNPGACAKHCQQHPSCVSFVFNAEKQFCQGHNQSFNNVTEGLGRAEQGSHYFTKG